MTRSSRHKSHRQSKHSSGDGKEHSDLEEDVKMKDTNVKGEGSVRVSRDSCSSEKRKLSLGKDSSGHGNGNASEEYVASKRRKEKAEDRWNGMEKEMKGESPKNDVDKSSKSTAVVDSKSKSSRRHDGGSEKKEDNVDLVVKKEESKISGRVESKRKSEKDSGRKEGQQYKDSNESKDKERGLEKERKVQDSKGETEARASGGEATRKQGKDSLDFGEEKQGKRGRENTDIQDELRNPELEKELEKRMRRRRDGSYDRDKYQVKESEDRRLSLKGDRVKDGRSKDEKRKDGSHGDKHREDGDRDKRNRDEKDLEDAERDSRHGDLKYREDGDKDNRHRDDKYQEDGERDNRLRDVKNREDGDRDNRRRGNKYHGDDRDNRHRDDKYHEASDRDKRHRNDKYREDGDRDERHRDDKYREDGDRDDDRHRDHWYLEDGSRDSRYREEKNREDVGRDGRHGDGKQRDDSDKDKRLRDVKHRDEHSRDRTSDKTDSKRLRDESNAVDHYRKATNRDGSPIFDDWSARYNDDKGRRRTSNKDDHGDIKSRSTNELHSDAVKKSMSSTRVESVNDRGRSNAHTDAEVTLNQSRRRSSPGFSSHAAKDHYRPSKQEESKYRDYGHDEKAQHNTTPSKEFAGITEKTSMGRSIEKSHQQYDSHLGELPAERRSKADARASPLRVVDKSPSSTSTDRRQLNRSDVRRSLDVEDSGQSGGSKDTKDYSGREGRGSRDLAMKILPGDDLYQADGDNISVSSPFSRNKSLLPPPAPFRIGADNHVGLGSLEDDNRGKSGNRHRRIGDPNTGRVQGSPWRAVPNWPSHVANGFLPFPHGPPPVGFHPVMHQYPAPPMFGVRPPMELNQSGVPFHVPDGSRFSGQGHPRGWRNPVDEPIHGWDSNNAVFGDESHIYGRMDWSHNRTLTGARVWEASGDTWKGQSSGVRADSPSAPQKEDYSSCGPADEVCTDQFVLQAQNNQKPPIVLTVSIEADQSSDTHARNTLEDPKTISEMPNLSRKVDACLANVYLSGLDISADLTQPELYSQFTSLMSLDQNTNSEEDSKFLLVEETLDATMKIPNKSSTASLFSTMNDSVLQKAMSVYKRLREEVRAIKSDKIPFCPLESLESAPTLDREGASDDDKPGDVVPTCDEQEPEVVSASNEVKMEESLPITSEKIKEELPIAALNEVKMEFDSIPEDDIVEGKSSNPENEELSQIHSPGEAEVVRRVNNERNNAHDVDTKCGLVLFSDVPSEAVMPESINLSRIHQSPESTH